jgi:hypothetical protein
VTDFDEPSLPPDDADVSRLLARYQADDAARDTGASREHVAEAWHDALDEALDDAVQAELERDAAR